MKILWFTWKDKKHPLAGGAEVINEALAERLAQNGHEVTLVVAGFPNAAVQEKINGYTVIRVGNRWTVYWQAYRYYTHHLQNWADVVIEEINTIPFFTNFYLHNEKRVLFFHQLCREIWFYQMVFPLSLLGYWLEPLYLKLLKHLPVITVSQSSKHDLVRYGFNAQKIAIITEGSELPRVPDLKRVTKAPVFTLLSLGALRPMKQTLDQIRAFELAKAQIPELTLVVCGDAQGRYGQDVLATIKHSRYQEDIVYRGKVSLAEKLELMQTSHLLLVTSVKEGWGLVVTEANTQGTPAVVYDVDGLRDSVRDGETGLITHQNKPHALAEAVVSLYNQPQLYTRLQKNAWVWSQDLTFTRSYQDFVSILESL